MRAEPITRPFLYHSRTFLDALALAAIAMLALAYRRERAMRLRMMQAFIEQKDRAARQARRG